MAWYQYLKAQWYPWGWYYADSVNYIRNMKNNITTANIHGSCQVTRSTSQSHLQTCNMLVRVALVWSTNHFSSESDEPKPRKTWHINWSHQMVLHRQWQNLVNLLLRQHFQIKFLDIINIWFWIQFQMQLCMGEHSNVIFVHQHFVIYFGLIEI